MRPLKCTLKCLKNNDNIDVTPDKTFHKTLSYYVVQASIYEMSSQAHYSRTFYVSYQTLR